MKLLSQLKKDDLLDKKVFLRVDFNVPVENGKISDDFKVKSSKETVDYLLEHGAKLLLVSHIDFGDTFGPIVEQLGRILGLTLTLVPHSELGRLDQLFESSPILLLDNIRQDPREEKNDAGFAGGLAKSFDLYVNDAFASCHRNHASVVAITKHLTSYAGFLIKKETDGLSRAIDEPSEGKVLIIGGAKISTKMPVIKNFIDKAEKILIGGALANDFFQAHGLDVGLSVVDNTISPDVESKNVILPEDLLITKDRSGRGEVEPYPVKNIGPDHLIIDIGPETAGHFAEMIKKSKMVIWNGPMGLSEVGKFAQGTIIVAKAVASAAHSIIGGGDTIAAVDKLGLLEKMSFVSTGGGAMLDFLAGEKLPGLVALGYYDKHD